MAGRFSFIRRGGTEPVIHALLSDLATVLPSLDEWMVWGPLGVFFGVFLWIGIDYYRSEIKPRAKQDREQSAEAHRAHLGFVSTTADCLPEIRDTLKGVIHRQDQHGEDIGWIKRRLGSVPPGHDPSSPPPAR